MSFEEKDVRADPTARWTLIEDLESGVTPTVVIGDRVIIGFDPVEYQIALSAIESGSEENNA